MLTITPIEDIIKQLLEAKLPYSPKLLLHFSDLDTPSLRKLAEAWEPIPVERRRALMIGLADLAETDPLQLFEKTARLGLKDADDEVVIAAIDLLFEEDDPQLIDHYLTLLQDNSRKENLRAAAANALVPYFYKCALEEYDQTIHEKIETALLSAYDNESSDLVRRRVLETLGYCNKPILHEIITRALAREQVYWTESALLAIGRTMDNSWDKTVLDYLHDDNPIILAQAVHAAGLLGIQRAKRMLFKFLNLDVDYDVRQETIWALSQLGGDDVIKRLEHFANITDDEDEIELIEDSVEYLELFGGDNDPTLTAFLIGGETSAEGTNEEVDWLDEEDDDENFFNTPLNLDEWERYLDDDDDGLDDEENEDEDEFDDFEDDEEF